MIIKYMEKSELIKLKQNIDDARQEASEIKGQLKQLYASLEEEFECKTIEEAKQKEQEIQYKIEKLNKKIEEAVEQIEENYGQK